MKAFLLFAAGGPVLILTNLSPSQGPALLKKLATYGKFIGFEVSLDAVKTAYAAHYDHVMNDPKSTDELRVLDADSKHIFTNIDFLALGEKLVSQPQR